MTPQSSGQRGFDRGKGGGLDGLRAQCGGGPSVLGFADFLMKDRVGHGGRASSS
jgi:hypothetical protein